MAKLVGSPTSDSTFTYQKWAKNTSLVDLLLSKGVVNSHSLHKVSHSCGAQWENFHCHRSCHCWQYWVNNLGGRTYT
jgi:hypothetical protein